MESCSDTNCCGSDSDDDGCNGIVSPLGTVFSIICVLFSEAMVTVSLTLFSVFITASSLISSATTFSLVYCPLTISSSSAISCNFLGEKYRSRSMPSPLTFTFQKVGCVCSHREEIACIGYLIAYEFLFRAVKFW